MRAKAAFVRHLGDPRSVCNAQVGKRFDDGSTASAVPNSSPLTMAASANGSEIYPGVRQTSQLLRRVATCRADSRFRETRVRQAPDRRTSAPDRILFSPA